MAKKQTRRAPRTVKRKKIVSKKSSTALVRRPAILPPAARNDSKVSVWLQRVVNDGFALDNIGLGELKTTPEEEKVLSRAPVDNDVLVLPDGAPYLPHPVYTRWLNEAFGRGGWSMPPVSKPALVEHTVVVKHLLFVHGTPIVIADGKQEYHPSNRNQDYGDVLEAARSNALRRACKHLGMALELWDKRWCVRWRREHCMQVTVRGRKKNDDGSWSDTELTQWRRKDDEPLKGELRTGRRAEPEANVETHSAQDERISKPKRDRFWRIAKRVGRNENDIKRWLLADFKIEKTDQILNRDYDKIVRILEAPGPLPTDVRTGEVMR